jgi:hypothetical protein
MRSDTVIKHEGFDAIFNKLDIVEAERFFALIRRDKFDYTEWRKGLFEDLTTDELSKKAMDFWKIHNNK